MIPILLYYNSKVVTKLLC